MPGNGTGALLPPVRIATGSGPAGRCCVRFPAVSRAGHRFRGCPFVGGWRDGAPRIAGVLALVLLAAASFAAPASAHQGDPDYRSEVTGIEPPVPGLEAEMLNYDSDMLLTNESDRTVVVIGYEGEPYLSFAPDGTVEANRESPAWYVNTDRYGDVTVPAGTDPDAKPDWKIVAGTGQYQWHDHRSHYMSTTMPPQVTDPDARTKIFDYAIPLEIDGEPGAIDGTLYWVGSGGFPALPFIGLGVLGLGSIVLVVVVRRRRSATEAYA